MTDDVDTTVQTAVALSALPFVTASADGTILAASQTIEALVGWRADDLVGRPLFDLVTEDARDAALTSFAGAVAIDSVTEWQPVPVPVTLLHRHGGRVDVTATLLVMPHHLDGRAVIQLRPAREDRLVDSAIAEIIAGADLAGVFEPLARSVELPDSRAVIGYGWDGEGFTHCAGSDSLAPAPEVTGAQGWPEPLPWTRAMSSGEAILDPELDHWSPDLGRWARSQGFNQCAVIPAVGSGHRARAALIVWRTLPGTTALGFALWNRVAGLIGLAIETQRRRAMLERAATIDQLTELENRRGLLERLDGLWVERPEAVRCVSALFCDLDGFKEVNDAAGHLIGDRLLAAIAQRIRNTVRPDDLVARPGGDEFTIVLCDTEEAAVEALADRLIDVVSRPVEIDGQLFEVGLSVGIAGARPGDRPENLLDRADQALLEAKADGKARWVRALNEH